MTEISQGDVLKIAGFRQLFLVVSKNAFIRATGLFHVCPVIEGVPEGALHIAVTGKKETRGTVICEQVKLIDPAVRACNVCDRLPYALVMEVSDAIQGIFEYD